MTSDERPRWKRWGIRLSKTLGVVGVGTGLLAAVGLGTAWWSYDYYVVQNPGHHIDRSHILSIIAQESPVYYSDQQTRIGVFFENEHREYVPYAEIPLAYQAAIVAAEDGGFWSHPGVSPKHILRAAWSNLQAGRVVSGGSTLSQQTAKNLYYRPDRSLRSKGVELVDALRLEHWHSKEQILEYYANQFHVSGNGRGLGIAARYFFNCEDVADLTLLQNAFLAGLVKSPSFYDPFLGSEERQQRSRDRLVKRTHYVLTRMVDEPAEQLAGPLPSSEADRAGWEARLQSVRAAQLEARTLLETGFTVDDFGFERGTFRFDSSAVLDEVRRRLRSERFAAILEAAGIEDPESAGLTVITTLDVDAQREAIYGLWHHLTEVGTQLEAIPASQFVRDGHSGPRHDTSRVPRPHTFRVGRVARVLDPDGQRHLEVDLGGGHACIVDRDAVIRAAVAVVRGEKKNRRAKASSRVVNAFVDALPVDEVVWLSVREVRDETAYCDLEVRPELQGATMVIDQGRILAMVGGNDNRNFNRATALRQFGSTWKPLVFHAAMELGWRPDSPLDNRRSVFPFSATMYWPRPAHTPDPVVSMSWAGVRSENIASVWLLYHLTDRLNGEQVRVLAEQLGLARLPEETERDYQKRINKAGVLALESRIDEALFLQARQEVLSGLALAGHPEDEVSLSSTLYGWGFRGERRRVASQGRRVMAWKEPVLDRSWTVLRTRIAPCYSQYEALAAALEDRRLPERSEVSDLTVLVDGRTIEVACGTIPTGYVPPDEELLADLVLEELETEGLFRRRAAENPLTLSRVEDVLVDDWLHLGTLRDLSDSLELRKLTRDAMGSSAPRLYDPELLYWHQDFRVLLGMRYVAELAAQFGVRTEVGEVLSMPLGASEITLEEVTRVYEGIITGATWDLVATSPATGIEVPDSAESAVLIAEVRDAEGRILYRAEPAQRDVTRPFVGELSADILRNTVAHGTGWRANQAVQIEGRAVPLAGKTGTTNDFRNAAFLGFAPRADHDGYLARTGAVIGVYVGYDDNRPMRAGNLAVDGAKGALPAWIGSARGLYEAELLGTVSNPPEGRYWPLHVPDGYARVPVDKTVGLEVEPGQEEAEILVVEAPVFAEASSFAETPRPTRVAPTTEAMIRALLEEAQGDQPRGLWE